VSKVKPNLKVLESWRKHNGVVKYDFAELHKLIDLLNRGRHLRLSGCYCHPVGDKYRWYIRHIESSFCKRRKEN